MYILECVDQTGWKQDLYIDCAIIKWLHLRTGWDQDPYTVCKNRMRTGLQLRLTCGTLNRLRTGSQGDRQKRRR